MTNALRAHILQVTFDQREDDALIVYTVQEGDTLWKIAKMHGLPLAAVMEANPQIADPDKMDVGMEVNVPTEGEGEATPTSEGRPGTGQAGLLTDQPEMPRDAFPLPEGITMNKYVVQSGDTLWKIAKKTGHSLASIIAANPQIANPDLIMPGQVITIPSGDLSGTSMGAGLHAKEMLTMPKAKMTEVKPVEMAPAPAPAPVMPSVTVPITHHEVDLTMLNYHPHYLSYHPHYTVTKPVKTEVKEKKVEHPYPVPMPVPVPYCSPCPPGSYPAIMDECGNIYPHPMYHHFVHPHMMPMMHAPYMAGPMAAPTTGYGVDGTTTGPVSGMMPGATMAPGAGGAPGAAYAPTAGPGWGTMMAPTAGMPAGTGWPSAADWQATHPAMPMMPRGEESAEEQTEE